MENNKVSELIELSYPEIQEVDGGIGFLAAAAIGAVVCIACDVGNEALKNKTGKDIGDWATYGAGYAVDKLGDGLEYIGNVIQ